MTVPAILLFRINRFSNGVADSAERQQQPFTRSIACPVSGVRVFGLYEPTSPIIPECSGRDATKSIFKIEHDRKMIRKLNLRNRKPE